MPVGGSQQLRIYRRARRDGQPLELAAAMAGIGVGEARLHDAEDAANPPPLEAYELLTNPEPAGIAGTISQEPDMARPKKNTGTVSGEVPKPDFGMAVRIYREDIKPAQSKVGEFAQEQSTAYKAIKKTAHIQPAAAKLAFRLDTMEESKRDDFLRCFRGLLSELKIFMPSDLVDQAQGKAGGGDVIPIGERKAPQLATVPPAQPYEGDNSDLAGDDGATGDSAASIWVVFDPEAQLFVTEDGKEWTDFDDCGKFDHAAAEAVVAAFGDDADGLQIVDSTGSLPGTLVSQAAE